MSNRTNKPNLDRESDRDSLFLEMLSSQKVEISEEAMAYFRKYPEEVDEVTAPTRVHRFFLWVGTGLGALGVALSKVVSGLPLGRVLGARVEEFLVEMLYEGGVALIGAALTAFFMGILLNSQQQHAKAYRKEIRRRLREKTPG